MTLTCLRSCHIVWWRVHHGPKQLQILYRKLSFENVLCIILPLELHAHLSNASVRIKSRSLMQNG